MRLRRRRGGRRVKSAPVAADKCPVSLNTFRHHAVVCACLAAAAAGPASADPPAAVRTARAPAAAVAGGPSAAPQALSPDPLERLRQLIEERLNAPRAAPPGKTRGPQAVRRGAAEGRHGAAGAQAKGATKPESAPCASKPSPGPIDIPGGPAVDPEPV